MLAPKGAFGGLPDKFVKELDFFKESMEGDNPVGGKVQMNPMPEIVKRMINKDSSVINQIKSDNFLLDSDKRIWTFPKFKSMSSVVKIADSILND